MIILERAAAGLGVSLALVPVLVWTVRRTMTRAVTPALVAVLTAAAAISGAVMALWLWPAAVLGAVVLLLAVPAAVVDAVEHRIPDLLSLPFAATVLLALGVDLMFGDLPVHAVRALLAGLAWGGLLLVSFLFTGHPGPGDVKLAVGLGIVLGWFGWNWLVTGVVLSYVLATVVAVAGVASGRLTVRGGRIPMGPAMVTATLACGTAAALLHQTLSTVGMSFLP